MSNEQYKWHSITYYVDEETGEMVNKSDIGTLYQKTKLIDSNYSVNDRTYERIIKRTMGCKKIPAVQLTIF